MKIVNLHTHSNFCDGTSDLEDYVLRAIELKLSGIGFSSHAPIRFETEWHMKIDNFNNYIYEIEKLISKYSTQIQIYKGLEIDYIRNYRPLFDSNIPELDFTIGSVHYLGNLKTGDLFCIDNSQIEFKKGLENIYNNEIKKLISDYYSSIIEMVQEYKVDVIGHFDLIKKLNQDNRYFDEAENWYREIVFDTIDKLKDTDCIFEINTRGKYKCYTKEFYPSNWIIEHLINENMPITINSDAHQPDELIRNFDDVFEFIISMDKYDYMVYTKNKWEINKVN